MWTLRRSAAVRAARAVRAAAMAWSVSGVSGTTRACRVTAAACLPVAPADHMNTSGRSVTHRPQRMHFPWSTRARPSRSSIAPDGHSPLTPVTPAALARTVAGPRQASAYVSGRCGQRVVATPPRSPRSTQMLTVPPLRTSQGCPRYGQAETALDEREVGQDVTGEHLVHEHEVVEGRRPRLAARNLPGLGAHVVDDLPLRGFRPAHSASVRQAAQDR